MQNPAVSSPVIDTPRQAVRLHYLDWLRVIAILGVFLFHSVHPFDQSDWHIKNADQSLAITIILTVFSFWGMPFFFMMAGTGSWFALRRRTPGQYATERTKRLLVPFFFGALLFMPIMLYLEWLHMTAKGAWDIPFLQFVLDRNVGFSPRWFASLGYHLWFLGFLFSFAILCLPLFHWLKGESGKQLLSRLAGLAAHHGGILLFVLPFIIIKLLLQPFFPIMHDWGDFFYLMAYFVLGFVLFADERFAAAIRRNGWISLIAAVVTLVLTILLLAVGDPFTWAEEPAILQFYVVWSLVAANGFYWCLFLLFLGMSFLDFSNDWLRYGQEAVLPFFVIHQPVIIVIAFFVVEWDTGIAVKLPVVVVGSFVVCIGLYELIIRRIDPLRSLFGMTSKRERPRSVKLA